MDDGKCVLCSECESRIRYNANKEHITGFEELRNILQFTCDVLQYVSATDLDIPPDQILYLISGIKTVREILNVGR